MTEPLADRTYRVLESVLLGAEVSEHFLTLPSGATLTIPEGADSWDVFMPHALAAIAEGLCPWCQSPLDERRQCFDARHMGCRWHVCTTGWGQVFFGTAPRKAATCSECGEVM